MSGKTEAFDIQATILNQLGFDHKKFTYESQGRPFRLTDVSGKVLTEILSSLPFFVKDYFKIFISKLKTFFCFIIHDYQSFQKTDLSFEVLTTTSSIKIWTD